MVACKTGDLDPVTTLVAPLVFAVGCKVDVSGHLGLQSEGSLVLRVQDFLGESWPFYLLLWAPGSPCHLKCHVMGHEGVLHPCEAKTKSLRSVPRVPQRHHSAFFSPFSLPAPWALSIDPAQEQSQLCSSTCHDHATCVDLWLDTCPSWAAPPCSRDRERQEGTRDEPHPRAEEQVCFPYKHRLITKSTGCVSVHQLILHTGGTWSSPGAAHICTSQTRAVLCCSGPATKKRRGPKVQSNRRGMGANKSESKVAKGCREHSMAPVQVWQRGHCSAPPARATMTPLCVLLRLHMSSQLS